MARQLNKRVVGVVTAIGFMVATTVGVVLVRNLRPTDHTYYVKQAEACAARQDWIQAKNFYVRAYTISKDARFLVDAGRVLFDGGDELAAEQQWGWALTVDPQLIGAHERVLELRRTIAELYKSPAAWTTLKQRAVDLLKVDPDNAGGHYALGLSSLEEARVELDEHRKEELERDGIAAIERAMELAPDSLTYALGKASYVRRADRAAEAEEILKRLRQALTMPGPDATRVRYVYGRFLAGLQRYDEAIDLYEEARTMAGNDPAIQADVASEYAQFWLIRWLPIVTDPKRAEEAYGYQEKARELLEQSNAADEENILAYLLLAELYATRGEHIKALELCDRRIKRGIARQGIRTLIRKSSFYTLLLRAAEECLSHAQTLDRNGSQYDEWITRAEKYATDASAEFADRGPGLHMLGKIRLAQGRELSAIAEFERARKEFGGPEWRNDRMLGVLLLRNGQPGAAREAMERAVRDPTADYACWGSYAEILLRAGAAQEALRAAERALALNPASQDALRLKAAALSQLGQSEMAEEIRGHLPDAAQDRLLEAQILYRAGRAEEALVLVEKLIEAEPNGPAYVQLAVTILVQLNQGERARNLVTQAQQRQPDDPDLKLLALDLDPSLTGEARSQAQLACLRSISSPFLRHYRVALWHFQRGEKDAYQAELDRAEEVLMDPRSDVDRADRRRLLRDVMERQFAHAMDRGDRARAEAYVEKAVKLNIDAADGQTYRARVHMADGAADLALVALQSALEKQPNNGVALAWAGQCCLAMKPPRWLAGRAYFERAVNANPDNAVAHRGMAVVAGHNGDRDLLEKHLHECERLIPDDPWVAEQSLALREDGAPAEGITRRLQIREQAPENVENLIRLGQLYARTGAASQAGECFTAALAVSRQDRRAVIAAAQFYRTQEQPDRAVKLLESNVESAEGDAETVEALLLLADHWHLVKRFDEAEAALRRAAAIEESLPVCAAFASFKSDIGAWDDAFTWFDKAIRLADEQSPVLAGEFRRSRIEVYLRTGAHRDAARGIDDYVARYPDDAQNGILLAAGAALRGDVDAAIAHLSSFLERHPDHAHALFQRASLYNALGRRGPAIEDLEKLKTLQPAYRNFEPRLMLADAYALNNQLPLAFTELESIVRDHPEAAAVASHLIKLYGDHGQYDNALAIATRMVNLHPDDPLWLKHRGELRLRLKDRSAALEDLSAAAIKSEAAPFYTTALLESCATIGQIDRGLTFYDQSIPVDKKTPLVKLRYAELLARKGDADATVRALIEALDASAYADVNVTRELGGILLLAAKDEDAAVKILEAPSENPRLRRAGRHLLGMLFSRLQRTSEALTIMQELLAGAEQRPEKLMLLATIGNLHEAQENWEGARETYEDLLRIDEQNVLGLNNLAYVLSDKLARPAEALPYAQRAVLATRNPTVRDTLAWVHVQLGQYRDAVALFVQVLGEYPTFMPCLYHLSETYRRMGELKQADEVLKGAEALVNESQGQDYAEQVRACRKAIDSGIGGVRP
ncbi:MAG: tetratricopeptide repeat protein [Phycisphaerales bacterium]|nr:tetratricopeptide repeat protein [Phycisphaerales bacterium]